MIEVTGNLWKYPADVRIITTNGTINSRGECVMGRGCAKEAKDMFPELPKQLAAHIRENGNNPGEFKLSKPDLKFDGSYAYLIWDVLNLITFPVKHNWYERADLLLIRTSVLQLKRLVDDEFVYVMPRPGCGNGGREWAEVKPLLKDLPDNVHVITFAESK